MTDAIKTTLLYALVVLSAVLGVATFLGHARLGIAQGQRDLAKASLKDLSAAVDKQKSEAAATLRTLNASVVAQQKIIDARYAQGEKTDAQNTQTIDGFRADLRRLRDAARRVLDAADSTGGGAGDRGASGEVVAGPVAGPGGTAPPRGLLPAAPNPEVDADDDAYEADRINDAYRSCRADALAVRSLTR